VLTDAERLQLQQLRLLDWAADRGQVADDAEPSSTVDVGGHGEPHRWTLTRGLELRPWQAEAAAAWRRAGKRGTIKVVTGAGKTVLAFGIAERLQHEDPGLRVAIVVPTIVLMDQWYAMLGERSNLPVDVIGRLGGGHGDSFDGKRVVIAVLATARKELPRVVAEAGIEHQLLLVLDESHRVGAPEMSAVLHTRRAYTLALSATPERDEEPTDEDRLDLSAELGPIVFQMNFADAIAQGILPPFEIHHFGLPLRSEEARQYSQLTRSLTDLRRELTAASKSARAAGGGERLLAWARRTASGQSRISASAAQYVRDTRRRKQLLYQAASRQEATLALIDEALREREDARVILFHESIDEVVALFEVLVRRGIPAVMEHSELPSELRERTLSLFRAGLAQVVVSARSLIEGFNVPEADLGIIVASSSSPRQRIQSIGRVLRRHHNEDGSLKTSRICVLYVRDSVDDVIYDRQDWDQLVGVQRNSYFTWDPPGEPFQQPGPPRRPLPRETEIELSDLEIGDVYPGRYDGIELSTDTQGNVLDAEGRIATNPQGIPARLEQLRGRAGRFKLTPEHRAVLVRLRENEEDWVTIFAGAVEEPFDFTERPAQPGAFDVSALAAGDPYPGPLQPARELRYRQRRGGVIAQQMRGGEAFARGPEADRAVAAIQELTRTRGPITKIFLNDLGHMFWREAGAARFIAAIDRLTFPSLEA
jgi:superfamily II DNA or RNA helicase